MTITQRLVRQPNMVLGVITAGLSLGVLFGIDITEEQMAGVGLFIGSLFGLVALISTPSAEVVAQLKPGNITAEAGSAAVVPNGSEVVVIDMAGSVVTPEL